MVNHTYCVRSQPVALKESHRDLGIIMAWDFSWTNRLEYVLSKAYKILGLLRRTFSNVGCTIAKETLHLTCKVTANVLLTNLASSISERYTKSRKHTETSNQIHY